MKREKIREKNKTNPRNRYDYRGLCGGEGGIRTGIYWILPCAGVSLQVPLSVAIPGFFEKQILFDVSVCRPVLSW